MTRLRELRKEQRLSAKELAEKVGTCPMTIYRYEKGERLPDIDVAMRLASALNVSIDELFKSEVN